ncbi:MAG: dephospho-CoA kinase [Chloroflexi bacterium]|nr:dephospho-CoA kinase [Chloroflexota bacterium]
MTAIPRTRTRSLSERYPDRIIIGLTGNIAVGKSLVLGLLAQLGAAVIDADEVAHQVLRRGGAAYAPVLAAFGHGILGADGEIARGKLGAIVFADPAQLRRLEAITHPAIRLEIDRRIRGAASSVVVIEAIKLLEGDLKNAVDAVWVVDAAPETQRRRLMAERGMSRVEAQRRIRVQNSQADKLRQADVVIANDGDLAATRAQVERAWAALRATRQSNQP